MEFPLDEILLKIYLIPFILILVRMLAFFGIAPLFSSSGFPNQGKVLLSAFLALIILFLRGSEIPVIELDLLPLVGLVIGEALAGMVLGFIVGLIFASIQLAGYIMGYQMGFAVANVLDPVSGEQSSVLGQFLFLFGLLTFLNIDGHHLLIIGMVESFDIMPVGAFHANMGLVDLMASLFQAYFSVAIKIALPVLGMILMVDISLGIVARTVPQMNVFLIGMPLKTLVGIFTLFAGFSFLTQLMKYEIYNFIEKFYTFVHGMG
ncbi:flagellar biosynthetic protein FliR [bacterium]|nr:flagellar biosynthetic protein FliR [bacterium]MBU1025238.1 flagellar biosynthetic protein FliR [bacterium]